VLAAVIFVSMTTYACKATVRMARSRSGPDRATASSAGLILSMSQEDRIERGQSPEIRIAADTAAGNVGEQAMTQLRAEAEAARSAEFRSSGSMRNRSGPFARLGKLRDELQQVRSWWGCRSSDSCLPNRSRAQRRPAARGLLSLRDRDARRSTALSAEQDMAITRRLTSSTGEISDVNARMWQSCSRRRPPRRRAGRRANLEQRMNDAEARRVQFVLSPVAGRVAALPVAAGQPVPPGGTVAVVIPEGAKLEASCPRPRRRRVHPSRQTPA
jgi:membrane fusion protein